MSGFDDLNLKIPMIQNFYAYLSYISMKKVL